MTKAEGIAWFMNCDDYMEILSMLLDPLNMPDDYHNWLILAKKEADTIYGKGIIPIIAEIIPETFSSWCKVCGLAVSTHALNVYADLEAKKFARKIDGGFIYENV